MRYPIALALLMLLTPLHGNTQEAAKATTPAADSTAMKQLFDEDQAIRQPADPTKIDWQKAAADDAKRREAVRKMLDTGSLHTALDFERAAFIFQHGDTADDYLLAHTLACISVVKGSTSAIWIATATLDRYLDKIGQAQIYGTQFHKRALDQPWTQEPYNRALISDALRKELKVPDLQSQQKELGRMNPHPTQP